MQERFIARTTTLLFAFASVVAVACGDDSTITNPAPAVTATAGTTNTPGDTTATSPSSNPPTSTGPVVSVVVTPHIATLVVGNFLPITVVGLDAKGVRVTGTNPTLRSSNSAIVSVIADTGLAKAVAVGNAVVYATINGHSDSTEVTVVNAPTSTPTPPTPPTPGIASFDFNGTVVAQSSGADTSKTTLVAGALVKLTRIGGVTGDTSATAIDAGSATTDANGAVSFKGLAGGTYIVDVTPPAGSNLAPLRTGFAPPRVSIVDLTFKLQPNP